MPQEPAVHRAGALKQTNKLHKTGKHRSNRQIDNDNKGRVSVKVCTKVQKRAVRRDERRLESNQIRKNKREDAMNKKRALGGSMAAPFLTCIIALNECVDPNSALAIIQACDEEAFIEKNNNVTYMRSPRLKQKFNFVTTNYGTGNELNTLDLLKICDSTILLMSASSADTIDKWGEKMLNMAMAQGIPTPVVTLMDMESIAPKRRGQLKTDIQKVIAKIFPVEKMMTLDKTSDGLNILRRLGGQKRNELHNKKNRAHLFSERSEFVPQDEYVGTLKVTGYLRGIPLSVNGLVHVPGLGDYQMSQIDNSTDPFLLADTNQSKFQSPIQYVIAQADPMKQTSLQRENIPDEMDAEQTFPTDAEIAESNEENKKIKLIKRIPKGMSEYQASWIPDIEEIDENQEDDDGSDDESENSFMSCDSSEGKMEEDEENSGSESENEDLEDASNAPQDVNIDHKYDEEMDVYEERKALAKIAAEKSDAIFPDEIDTPQDVAAHIRFQKYRGLESFRTSPWDVKENLPIDYAKIYQFKDFNRVKRRIIKDAADAEGDVEPGMYITIHISKVPRATYEAYKTMQPQGHVVLYGLLPHEHKMSVMNVLLKRTQDSSIPIKSKERLIFQCGYRRFMVNPVFSQHTNSDKHKYERFFQPNATVVATFFAPIQFPPSPVLCFRENPNTSLTLVATGSLLSCTPDRVVLKRVVLSGHPFKIHRKLATIRFMFHNKEDINYFKPCKLRTKTGRIGHIKESLGTHGHMKCVFDGQLKSFDTIFLYLYKRVFPKWNFEDLVVSSSTISPSVADMHMD